MFEEEVAATAASLLINTHNGCLLDKDCHSQQREAVQYHIGFNYDKLCSILRFLHFVPVISNNQFYVRVKYDLDIIVFFLSFASEPFDDGVEVGVSNLSVEYQTGRNVFLLSVSSDRAPLIAVPVVVTEESPVLDVRELTRHEPGTYPATAVLVQSQCNYSQLKGSLQHSLHINL